MVETIFGHIATTRRIWNVHAEMEPLKGARETHKTFIQWFLVGRNRSERIETDGNRVQRDYQRMPHSVYDTAEQDCDNVLRCCGRRVKSVSAPATVTAYRDIHWATGSLALTSGCRPKCFLLWTAPVTLMMYKLVAFRPCKVRTGRIRSGGKTGNMLAK